MMFNVFLVLSVLICHSKAANYTLTASRRFRPDNEYKFFVTLYGKSSAEYHLEARIRNTRSDVTIVEDTFRVETTAGYSLFSLKIPKLVQPGPFIFEVSAEGDVNFNKSHVVNLAQKTHSVFIQTDKYFYKPGQSVLFRVLGIQSDLKPYTKVINTTIYDHSGNKIYELLNQRNQSGVINGRLKLSHITPLGTWKIESKSEMQKSEAFFEVAEYVLPKFEVKVLLPSYFFANRKNPSSQQPLHITATATYTFGKPVKGYAVVTVKVRSGWGYTYAPSLLKHVELLDGKADITVSVEEIKQFHAEVGYGWHYHDLFVQANVTEAATGIILQGNNTIPIKMARYELKFLDVSSNNFKPGFPYRAHIKLSQSDGSEPKLSDIKFSNGSFKFLKVDLSYFNNFRQERVDLTPTSSSFQVPLTSNGFVFCEIPVQEVEDINIVASFFDDEAQDTISVVKNIELFRTRDKKNIQLSIENDSTSGIKPGSTLALNVLTSEDISSFQYQIIGRGQILQSDIHVLEVPSSSSKFSVNINDELSFTPELRVVVSYITSTGELVADSLSLSVTDYMPNKVSLLFKPDSTLPGEDVVLRVNASQDSFVSLSAIDQSVLLLSNGNEITQEKLFKDIKKYNGDNYVRDDDFMFWRFCWPSWIGGSNTQHLLENSGIFVLTNFHVSNWIKRYPVFYLPGPPGPGSSFITYESVAFNTRQDVFRPQPTIPDSPRKHFPETWIWTDVQTGSDGLLELKYKVPDTITSWIASAFATNSRHGLGITDQQSKLTVMKPFFISLNLPYSTVRGEQFALQVTVFNYYGEDLSVTVILPKSNYFNVKECLQGSENLLRDVDAHKDIFVKDNDLVTVYFWIVPTNLGQIPIEVRAVSALAADSLLVNLLVKPEGQPQSYSSSSLIRLPPDDLSEINFEVSLPPKDVLVPGSVIIEATLIGDVLGTTINNLDNLLQMPYGCGEQNMVTLAPDVYIVKYLTATNQLTQEITNKALEFINAGYQRELTYQRRDGSFSAFGDSDKAGSVWLSAFVVKVFHEAQDIIPVDDQKIARTLRWILQHQNHDGSFSEPPEGKVLHTGMQGGASSGIALTAYVLISLLVNRNIKVESLEERIGLTVSYLEEQSESLDGDPYILSVISYGLYLAQSPKLNDVLERLNSLAISDGGFKYWHKAVPGADPDSSKRISYSIPQSNDIEMTSYVLLIYASQLHLSHSIPIAKWLISKRNPEGGFSSTQDTVLGLEALALFGQMVVPPPNSDGLDVQVTNNVNNEAFSFKTVNKDTALLLQSHQIPSDANSVTFSASGEGLALVQLNVRYYVNSGSENTYISQSLHTNASDTKLELGICSSWSGPEETGMVLTEVYLLTGYTLAGNYAEVLKEDVGVTFKKEEFSNNRLSIYLDELTSTIKCFRVKMKSIYYVQNVKPALVKSYRYYAPDVSVSGYYSPTSTSAIIDVCDSLFNLQGDDNNQMGPS